MGIVTLIVLAASLAKAESHPNWWTLAEPEATALVGINWENLRSSPFAGAIQAELPDFPAVPLIMESRQILISSPSTLAILSGNFPVETLHKQASAKGLKAGSYRGIELFLSPQKDTLSIAQLTDQVLLLGLRKTLERAIDRSLAETARRYSPLLSRGARMAQGKDLWVVATGLPDPLASLFVPIEADANGFEGGVSLRDGLQLEASFEAGSPERAEGLAVNLRQEIQSMPAFAQAMEVRVESRSVALELDVAREDLAAAMRTEAPAPKPAAKAVEEAQPTGPQVIRIYGLDGGPREIVLPPVKVDKPR